MLPAMFSDEVSSISFAYSFVKIFGVLNYEGRPWSMILTIYNVLMVHTGLIGSFFLVLLERNDLQQTFQALSALSGFIHVIGKALNALVKQEKIRNLFGRLETVRLETLENEETKIFILRADKFLKIFIIIYNTIVLSYPVVISSINFINDYQSNFEQPHLSLSIWIPWNRNEFWRYLGASIIQAIILITTTGYYGSLTSLQFTFAFQISGFLKALQYHLETHGSNSRSVYQQHITIIQLIEEYNSIFSGQMYLEILVSPLQPCGFGYALIKALKQNDPSAGSLIITTFLTTLTSFTICYCGQEVSTQMEKLHTSAYMNHWFKDEPKVRRDLLQMMIITGNPTVFNYRRWINFNYVTFATVMQGIYTYLSMIANFVDG